MKESIGSERWDAFFSAEVGASAALAGLLFVGLSINIERILAYPWLPRRAAEALTIVVAALLQASVPLWPGQPPLFLGVELFVVTLFETAVIGYFAIRDLETRVDPSLELRYRKPALRNFMLFCSILVPGFIGSIIVARGSDFGLYWIATTIVLSFVYSILSAWVLTVEILR